jgi:hypothetical protein
MDGECLGNEVVRPDDRDSQRTRGGEGRPAEEEVVLDVNDVGGQDPDYATN